VTGPSWGPTPPIDLDVAADQLRHRFAPAVEVDAAFVRRLQSVCASVDTGVAARTEAGRDWWPLTMAWAVQGETPALPAVVARPGNATEVAAVLAVCNDAGVPVTAMAGRSGVCGASIPLFGGVALDLCSIDGVLSVDDQSLLVDVRAGTFGPLLEQTLRDDHGVTLGHWPQSMALSTVPVRAAALTESYLVATH